MKSLLIGLIFLSLFQTNQILSSEAVFWQEARQLETGPGIVRDLKGDDVHQYRLTVEVGKYIHVRVEQQGIDVVVRLMSPDGNQIVEIDSPNGRQGPEELRALIESAGTYRIEIRSLDKGSSGGYTIRIAEMRQQLPQDSIRIAAHNAFREGEILRLTGKTETIRRALVKYEEALKNWKILEARSETSRTMFEIARSHRALGENRQALDRYEELLPLLRETGNASLEAAVLNNLANIHADFGDARKGIEYLDKALQITESTGNQNAQATFLNSLGAKYDEIGDKKKALEYYDRALKLRRIVRDRRGEAVTLHNMGILYNSTGEYTHAAKFMEDAMKIYQELNDQRGMAFSFNGLGMVYDALGEYQKALDYYRKALDIRRELGDRSGQAFSLNNIGFIYDFYLDEKQRAVDYFNQALDLHRSTGHKPGEALAVSNLGRVYSSLGEEQKAHDLLNLALDLNREIENKEGESIVLHNLGWLYKSNGKYQQALDYYSRALVLIETFGNRKHKAYSLHNLGGLYDSLGENDRAVEYLSQSLTILENIGDVHGEASTRYGLARVERERGNLAESLTHIEKAIAIGETLRKRIDDHNLRSSYFATVQDYYALSIDLNMQLHKQNPTVGRDALAFATSERARARGLLDLLTEAGADLRSGVDTVLVEEERNLQRQLNARAQYRMNLLNSKHTQEQLDRISREFAELTSQYQALQTKIRSSSPRYASLTEAQPLDLKDVQEWVLDSDTMLLEYSLGEDRSYLWAVSKDGISSFELPRRDEIEESARRYYRLISDETQSTRARRLRHKPAVVDKPGDGPDLAETAAELSRMLIQPLGKLNSGKRLLIVADGALQYVPFAALPDMTGQPLILGHEVLSLPSASAIAVSRRELEGRKPAPKTLAVIADPVFDGQDPRVKRQMRRNGSRDDIAARRIDDLLTRSAIESGIATVDFMVPRLPGTRREAIGILSMVPASERKQSLDFDASLSTATGVELADYRIIHFATHGILNSVHPELSGIVLSLVDDKGQPRNGFLRLHQIYNLKLPADLIVLSACQTGLGKEIRGEGLVGLTRGFMYAGAARVQASLWNVNDRATSELMKSFYQGMLKEGLTAPAALRKAQIAMLRQKRWASPYFWSAFIIQGEWR
ncbi:MAG: CHAT domain-containing protein [Acidobacteria bacterium]|nr:CHAT domain-containing protein [Acidobacteriota bacterium]